MVEYKGNKNVVELSALLQRESPRCLAIVGAAFFDETLARLLGDTKERCFFDRIEDALDYSLLSPNEHHDLHVVRRLRNEFAHDLRTNSFDESRTVTVDSMETWKYICTANPHYPRLYPTAADRLLYVIGVIAFRLQHRAKSPSKTGPLPEPDYISDPDEWPPTVSGV